MINVCVIVLLLITAVSNILAGPIKDSNSCRGRCNAHYDPQQQCQCNQRCVSKGDCCSDYNAVCQVANITDDELITISGQLWDADKDDRISVQLAIQAQIDDGSTTDQAPNPLFTDIPNDFVTNPLYAKQIALYDFYVPNETVPEVVSPAKLSHVEDFLDAVMSTDVAKKTHEFLASKGVVPDDEDAFKDQLNNIWYSLYVRSGTLSSSGGEHVQMGETKSDDIDGFHSWIRFALLEHSGDVNYLGYVRIMDLGGGAYVIRNPFYWNENYKPIGGFFIGTSPAFDMSVYTLCFFARPDSVCNVKLNGSNVPIQTYTMDYNSSILVGSSYPNY